TNRSDGKSCRTFVYSKRGRPRPMREARVRRRMITRFITAVVFGTASLAAACAREHSVATLQPASHRIVEARLTGMPYAPYRVVRGGETNWKIEAETANAHRTADE